MTAAYDHPVQITYQARPGTRREPAITIALLAEIKGWTTKRAQTAVARIKPPIAPFPRGLDKRTPLYPRVRLLAAIDHRPGRGKVRK